MVKIRKPARAAPSGAPAQAQWPSPGPGAPSAWLLRSPHADRDREPRCLLSRETQCSFRVSSCFSHDPGSESNYEFYFRRDSLCHQAPQDAGQQTLRAPRTRNVGSFPMSCSPRLRRLRIAGHPFCSCPSRQDSNGIPVSRGHAARWGGTRGTSRAFRLSRWAQLLLNALSFLALTPAVETSCFL